MKITCKQLRQLIQEELSRFDEILLEQPDSVRFTSAELGHGIEVSAQDQIDALHWALAGISFLDPTMLTDVVDSFIYSLEGDHESAALVLAASAAGLGAGAAVARLVKVRKAAKQAKSQGKITDETFEAVSKSLDDAERIAREAAENNSTIKAPAKKPGGSHYVNPGRGHRVTSSGNVVKAEPGTSRGQGHSRGGKSDPRAHLHILDKVYRNAMSAAQEGDYSFWQLYAGTDPSKINFPIPGSKRWIQFEKRYGISPSDFHSQYSGNLDKIRPPVPNLDLSKILNAAKGLGRKLNPSDDELVLYRGVKDKSLTSSEMTGHSGSGVQDFAANPNVAITYAGENGTVYAIKVPYDDAIDQYYSGSHALNSWKDGKTTSFLSEVYRVPLAVLEAAYKKGNFIGTGNISF